MKVEFIPTETGIECAFFLIDGKKKERLNVPLQKEQIEQVYRLPGFMRYVAWEEMYEAGVLEGTLLPYSQYYELLQQEEEKEIIAQLGLPTTSEPLTGELQLKSLPQEGNLFLKLYTEDGKNLNRVASEQIGAMYKIGNEWYLLPDKVYQLKQALNKSYENGYQKVGVCQKLAKQADIHLDSFLENESYHVVDEYDLDVKVHNHDHIELIPIGTSKEETIHLNQPHSVVSFKEGSKRQRYVKTEAVLEDLKKIETKRHIRGEEVPLFFENPYAVLPEHDYQLDLERFSDRVKGLVPVEHVRQDIRSSSGVKWFSEGQGTSTSYDESFLRELMEKFPNQQYVEHEGKWIYLDPLLRKKLMQPPEDEENKFKKQFVLDIKDNEDSVEYALDGDTRKEVKHYPIPQDLRANLFQHQIEGFQWICNLAEKRVGGLLADDMGLGKTIQVITFLLYQKTQSNLKPTLIVLPIALIENWIEEIQKFAPSLSSGLYVHRGSSRLRSAQQIEQFDIVFTSYDTLKIDQLLLGKIKFQSIICDEAQNVKSHSSQRSRALRAMQSEFRLAMTGTPVENSLEELWSIMDFVQPGEFGSLREFRKSYVETADYGALLKMLEPYYLRRTKKEILDDRLPKKHPDKVFTVEASSIQKSVVESMLETKEAGQIAILNMLMRLRQLYGHPGVVIPEYEDIGIEEVPKFQKLINIIEDIRQKNEKVLIFTEFRKLHHIFKRLFMQKYGISVPVIDGQTKNRQAVVRAFNESPGFGMMILSPKAAGVGLTITSANHVVHYTRWWNPAVENQATDRAYRIGQERDVYVYQIITTDKTNFPNGTVEELMHQLLEHKRSLAENVIVPFNITEIQKMVAEKVRDATLERRG